MTRSQSSPTTTSPPSSAGRGWVAFVGSGPGDPGLLTVRATDLLRSADVVITEGPEHPALIRSVLGLPEGSEGGPELADGGLGEGGPPRAPAARAPAVGRQAQRGPP